VTTKCQVQLMAYLLMA